MVMLTVKRICRNCEHWEQSDEIWGESAEGAGRGLCASGKLCWDILLQPPADGLSYMDGEEYAAMLVVGPEFGCIHWRERGREVPEGTA